MPLPLRTYLRAVEQALRAGNATEHTHRPALKTLIESLRSGIVATNEPTRVECGAPDFAVSKSTPAGLLTVGHVETKDVSANLSDIERGPQLKRYLLSLPNLVLTDYLEFRWYVDGESRATARLGRVASDGRIARDAAGLQAVEALLGDFLAHVPEPITKPKELAERMARLTHIIRDIIIAAFANDRASDALRDMRNAFAKALIPDLDKPEKTAQFADMYAQTIAYGLFAARCNHGPAGPFRRLGAAAEIPKTNPFLRKLFDMLTGTQLDDEPYCGFVDDLAALLNNANIEEILAEFGARTRREDPVVHFYETFLATYDPQVRERRGVYYTPEPVVSYIVRSVDHLLRTRFGLPGGLGDTATIECEPSEVVGGVSPRRESVPKVLILDPACGTGTFLYAVVDHIREQFIAQGNAGMWSGYVRNHLLPRLFGFELLMAPYAVAHLKLGMQLAAQDLPPDQRATWAYDFAGDERLGIYLTNTLEEAERRAEDLFGPLRVITEEANAAARIKLELPIMAVMGNPPYSVSSANKGEWIMGLLEDYKRDIRKEETQIQAVSDDYVKFIRFAQWRVERTGRGIVGMITNNGYLNGPLFRDMRRALTEAFDEIYILNLHGSTRRRETTPVGGPDRNVFDIQQGVAILLLVRSRAKRAGCVVRYADLWGTRDSKYDRLNRDSIATTGWTTLAPASPMHWFVPRRVRGERQYLAGWAVPMIYGTGNPRRDQHNRWGAGFATRQDEVAIGFTPREVLANVRFLADSEHTWSECVSRFRLCTTQHWKPDQARRRLATAKLPAHVVTVQYRPFDYRSTVYLRDVVLEPRAEVMRHLLQPDTRPNLALVTARIINTEAPQHVFVSRVPVEKICISPKTSNNAFVFPLYTYPDGGRFAQPSPWPLGPGGRAPNLSPGFVHEMEARLRLSFVTDGAGELSTTFGPEDIFHYLYAITYSPGYRKRYAEFLKEDFPRLPITSRAWLFRELCHLGADLVALHLLEEDYPHASWNRVAHACPFAQLITTYPVRGDNRVERGHPKYAADGRVHISRDDRKAGKQGQYFDGVPPEVWAFHVGGYQVCEKWLKDRVGRQLSYEDLTHYQRVVVALKETIRLMAEIDSTLDAHGGWPIQ